MGQFKPMVKMITTEPTVELKLKKGGHVAKHHKKHEEHHEGHKKVAHKATGGLGVLSNPMIATPPAAPRARVGKPSLGARMAAMKGMTTPMMAKKGGKAHHAHGGKVEKEVKHLAHELKHHEGMKARKAHHGLKDGGKVSEFENTKMDTAHHDTVHGTGGVKMGAAGYKHGGKIHHAAHHAHGGKVHHISGHPVGSHEHHKHMAKHHAAKHKEGGSAHHHKMHEHHKHLAKMAKGGVANFAETEVVTAHHDSAHGTGEVKEGKPGGYKHGGKMHAHHAHHMHGGKVHHKATGGVMEGKPAGYKRGGAVEDSGRPVDMPQGMKKASAPVTITKLSGTFKKGGKVHHKAHGGKMHHKDMC